MAQAAWLKDAASDSTDGNASQPYCNFTTTDTWFGILANQVVYRFYSELGQAKRTDERPEVCPASACGRVFALHREAGAMTEENDGEGTTDDWVEEIRSIGDEPPLPPEPREPEPRERDSSPDEPDEE